MYTVIIICGLLAALITAGVLLHRRRLRRINEMVAAVGGKVVRIGFTGPPLRDLVDYVGPQGELRRAFLSRRAAGLSDDQPFQCVLREDYENSRSDLLRTITLAAKQSLLPGRDEYLALALELAAGSIESATVEETPSVPKPRWRFALVLQCFEAADIVAERSSEHILDLVVNGTPVDLHWSVQGVAPHRLLVVRRVPSRV
jgi:hypothetical protein